jgi:hypothetical protein
MPQVHRCYDSTNQEHNSKAYFDFETGVTRYLQGDRSRNGIVTLPTGKAFPG